MSAGALFGEGYKNAKDTPINVFGNCGKCGHKRHLGKCKAKTMFGDCNCKH